MWVALQVDKADEERYQQPVDAVYPNLFRQGGLAQGRSDQSGSLYVVCTEPTAIRSDSPDVREQFQRDVLPNIDCVILSPGPGRPDKASVSPR
jgi:hypothetical protein